MYQFEVDGKTIDIFYSQTENNKLPVVILNTFDNEGQKVWEECKKINSKDFILIAVSNLNWNNDMTPWKCPPIYKGDSECLGLADEYIKLLEEKIIPKAKEYIVSDLHKEIEYFAIAGYSLAGLFSIYSAYKTDIFKKLASASGSLWYPNFAEYVKKNEISRNVDKIYFSLGNKEANSKNEVLQKVEEKTKEIYDFLGNNIKAIFEENEGNHFQNVILRTAKSIKWIIE